MTFKKLIIENQKNIMYGVEFIPKSYIGTMLVTYDEIDRTNKQDHPGKKPGTPLRYEIERFKNDYDIDIEYLKKSDFPFTKYVNSSVIHKVKILDDFEIARYEVSTYSEKGLPKGYIRVFLWNDNMSFLVNKKSIKQLEELSSKEFNQLIIAIEK